MVLMMAVLMNHYHLILILRNLTTNEDMNKHRYAYLRNDVNRYHNPFSQGPCGNCREFVGRRAAVEENPYVHTELIKAHQTSSRCDGAIAAKEEAGDFEMDKVEVRGAGEATPLKA